MPSNTKSKAKRSPKPKAKPGPFPATDKTAALLAAYLQADAHEGEIARQHQRAEAAATKAYHAAQAALLRHLRDDLHLPVDVEETGKQRGVVVGDRFLYRVRFQHKGKSSESVGMDYVIGTAAEGSHVE